jgi:hypothetical protein
MIRVRPLLFNGLGTVSLMLCLATAVSWARSYNVLYIWSRFDTDSRSVGYREKDIRLDQGRVTVSIDSFPQSQLNPWIAPQGAGRWNLLHDPYWFADRRRYPPAWFVWFESSSHTKSGGRIWQFGANLGVLAVCFAIFPAVLRVRYLRARRIRRLVSRSLCTRCGYDLRATPDRCPECGTVPPKKDMVST